VHVTLKLRREMRTLRTKKRVQILRRAFVAGCVREGFRIVDWSIQSDHNNAPMESWFHSLKVELVHDEQFITRQQAFAELFDYIEVFYNRQRLHTSIGSVSPVAFEKEFLRKAA